MNKMFGRNKKEEKIYREISSVKEPKSRANRIRMLLKKNYGVFKDKQKMTDFKEPVLMLVRRGRAVEFFEDASKGSFVFKHSDGVDREIYLEPSHQLSFDYGKRKFKGYICYEDNPLPLPENPLVTVDTINGIVEKTGMDMKKLSLKSQEIKLKTWKMIGWFVAIAIILLILWQSHAFEKLIGLVTGNPYVEPTTIIQTTGGGNAIADNSLQIASSGNG